MMQSELATFSVSYESGKDGITMAAIPKEYLLLFNALTDAEHTLSQLRETLLEVQRQAEELYVERTGEEDRS